jgi:hypothetical protein
MVGMRRLALVAFVALVALACGAPAAPQAQDVRLAYHTGDTYKYAIHSTANEAVDAGVITIPIKLDMKANQTVTVKSVDAAGTAELLVEMTSMSLATTVNGTNNTTTVPTQTISMQVGSDGRIASANGTAVSSNPFTAISGVGGGFISAVLPDKPVQPGDKWSKSYDQANPQGSGSIHVTTDSKYLKDEAVPGVTKASVIETTSNSTIDLTIDMTKLAAGQGGTSIPGLTPGSIQSLVFKGTVKGVTTSWIDPSTHRVAKTHRTSNVDATMTMNFSPSAAQSMAGLTGPINIKGDETTDLTPS